MIELINRKYATNRLIKEYQEKIDFYERMQQEHQQKLLLNPSVFLVLEQGEDGLNKNDLVEMLVDECNCSYQDAQEDIEKSVKKGFLEVLNNGNTPTYYPTQKTWRFISS